MRTSVDIPDDLMAEVRAELAAQGLTFREAVIDGLRRTLLQKEAQGGQRFEMRDASFRGEAGFRPGFDADSVGAAIRSDAEERMVAERDAACDK